MRREFDLSTYPPFPEGFPTASLIVLSLSKLLNGDQVEADRLFEACKTKGFFYLNLENTEAELLIDASERLAYLAEDIFTGMPQEDKDGIGIKPGTIFGYKAKGASVTDKSGTPDTAEFLNISKNDMIIETPSIAWPAAVLAEKKLLTKFVRTAHSTGLSILGILADRLGVPFERIAEKHRIEESSGDQVRLTRGPARITDLPEIQTPAHTDFGTITILFNWLGGLQVWSNPARGGFINHIQDDESGEWLYVKPLKNHAIVNLGDVAVKFTNGILCSGKHRVVAAPGEQGKYPRYSVVYFVRPEDHTILKQLQSDLIPQQAEAEEEITAKDWIIRQTRSLGFMVAEK